MIYDKLSDLLESISSSKFTPSKEDVLSEDFEVLHNLPIPIYVKCEGEFYPKLNQDQIIRFNYEVFWQKMSYLIQSDKQAKRRDFTEDFTSTYNNLINPFTLENKIESSNFPRGLQNYFIEEEVNDKKVIVGWSDRGMILVNECFNQLNSDYEKRKKKVEKQIAITNDLLKISKEIKAQKLKKGCNTKYEVGDIPYFVWKNMYPSVTSLHKQSRKCEKNGKSGITHSFLKQMTNKYQKESYEGETYFAHDNEKTIRHWSEEALNIAEDELKRIHDFFNQKEVVKRNLEAKKKYIEILKQREIYVSISEKKAEEHDFNQLYKLSELPKIASIGYSMLNGLSLFVGKSIVIGVSLYIYLNGEWAVLSQHFASDFFERKIEDKSEIKELNSLRDKFSDKTQPTIAFGMSGSSFYAEARTFIKEDIYDEIFEFIKNIKLKKLTQEKSKEEYLSSEFYIDEWWNNSSPLKRKEFINRFQLYPKHSEALKDKIIKKSFEELFNEETKYRVIYRKTSEMNNIIQVIFIHTKGLHININECKVSIEESDIKDFWNNKKLSNRKIFLEEIAEYKQPPKEFLESKWESLSFKRKERIIERLIEFRELLCYEKIIPKGIKP